MGFRHSRIARVQPANDVIDVISVVGTPRFSFVKRGSRSDVLPQMKICHAHTDKRLSAISPKTDRLLEAQHGCLVLLIDQLHSAQMRMGIDPVGTFLYQLTVYF